MLRKKEISLVVLPPFHFKKALVYFAVGVLFFDRPPVPQPPTELLLVDPNADLHSAQQALCNSPDYASRGLQRVHGDDRDCLPLDRLLTYY